MKLQVTMLVNVDLDPKDYAQEDEVLTDEEFMERVQLKVDDGNLSMDDLIEQGTDYTVTVVKGQE